MAEEPAEEPEEPEMAMVELVEEAMAEEPAEEPEEPGMAVAFVAAANKDGPRSPSSRCRKHRVRRLRWCRHLRIRHHS